MHGFKFSGLFLNSGFWGWLWKTVSIENIILWSDCITDTMSNAIKYRMQGQAHGKCNFFSIISFLMIWNSMMNSGTNFLNTLYIRETGHAACWPCVLTGQIGFNIFCRKFLPNYFVFWSVVSEKILSFLILCLSHFCRMSSREHSCKVWLKLAQWYMGCHLKKVTLHGVITIAHFENCTQVS